MRLRFAPFEFDSATRELTRDGTRVHLSPKAFDLLQLLIERRPALVTKPELQDSLWPDVVVVEANLGNAVAEVRKALGDDPKSPRFVWTVSRRGYRFAAAVEVVGPAESARLHGVRWWLAWRDTILPLSEGENVVGRHPESDVWLDATSVSRVHARVVIADGRATVEDLESTNGTSVDGVRITSRHALVDGSTVTFGSERTVFREWSDATAPATERVHSSQHAKRDG
ncbi:MAG TPA: FHA domain-containing protein [Vicinamibacterales bacterium]|nr:FHA domain-containing protein [Vicinamibacterales bacterium]